MLIVESNKRPFTVEYFAGNTYVNINIKAVAPDSTLFRYSQDQLAGVASKSSVEDAITRGYEHLIQQESLKVAGALRSTALGVSVDYDEAILMDVETTCAALYMELYTTLATLNV